MLVIIVAFKSPLFEKEKVDNESMFALPGVTHINYWTSLSFP